MKRLIQVISVLSSLGNSFPVSAQVPPGAAYGTNTGRLPGYIPEPLRFATAKPVPATLADIRTGILVRGNDDHPIGTISSVDAEGAVVDYGNGNTKVPLRAFGRDKSGLVMTMTRAEFIYKATHPH